MITTLPLSTAEIVNAVLPRNVVARGVVERKIADDVYVIALAAGKITLKVSGGQFSEGDQVALQSRAGAVLVEKAPPQTSGAPPPAQDSLLLQTSPDGATLKLLADTAAEQLKKQVIDKDTLDQLQRILSAVAKNPQRFGADTVNAVADLKKIVAAMPSGGADVDKTAQDIAGRIISLGEKFAEKLKSDAGAVDVILRAGTKAVEGYYSFDTVKSAISWLSENKEIRENVPWQKLSNVFGDGGVVIKVYESAIGDKRASFVAPQQTGDELSHFTASSLRADVWKNVSEKVLTSVLHDLKEIPLSRLLEIDSLLKESEEQPQEFSSAQARDSGQSAGTQTAALQTKGFEAAFTQWLTISLDSDAPFQRLISRVPVESSQQIPSFLASLDDAAPAGASQEPALSRPVTSGDFSIQQETLAAAPSPETVLPELFRRLGLNLESALSKGGTPAAEIHPQNLKAVLLTLLGTIESAAARAPNAPTQENPVPQTPQAPEPGATTPPATQTPSQTTASPSPDADAPAAPPTKDTAAPAQDIARNVRLVVSSVSLNLKAVFDEAAAIVRSVEGQTHTVADNAAPQQLIDKAEAARNLTSRIEAFVQAMPKTASGDVERLVRAFQQAGDVLSAQPDRQAASPAGIDAAEKGPAGTPEDLAAAAGRQIIAKVNEIAGRLQDLGRQLMQSEEKIPRDAASPANRQADLVQNSLKEALRQLDSLARAATDQTSSASREISRTLDDLASEVSKRLDNMASDQDRQQQRGPLDVLKQQVENALTRVESLQVLARQVSVTDGQQQVISLPMKIEGQWTDVVVKFLKKKDPGGNKDAPDKPVSVAIHVSPAMLGQIDVFMDYRGKKRFSMRMEFEKTATRSWFEKNKTDFSAALSQIGFTTFKIDMKEAVRNARRGIAAPAQNAVGVTSSYDDRGPGVIDITA